MSAVDILKLVDFTSADQEVDSTENAQQFVQTEGHKEIEWLLFLFTLKSEICELVFFSSVGEIRGASKTNFRSKFGFCPN